jgi:putative aldouronate transport system substrate-binding protein
VLKAFKDKDPNGNGKPDEIPYTGLVTSKNWNSPIPFVMSAFITDDYDRRFVQPFDGTVDVIFNKPEWREGLMYLNRLYTDGLLDNEAFTHDRTLLTQKVENPDAPLVGAVSSNAPSTFANADTERFASYDPIAPIEGPSGLRSAAITNPSLLADGKSGHFVITNKCKNPDIAFRWADTMYDVEMNTYNIFGREGHEWRKAEPGEIGINGKPALWATITQVTGGTSQNVSWNQTVHSYRPEYWRYGEVRASEELYYKRAGMETRLYDALQLYVPYTKGPAVTFSIYIDPSKAKEYNDLKTNIYDFVYQYTSRFITGDLNLTSDWDNYLNQLDKMGLKDYIKMTQEAIDSTKVN